jgi:hypothetical protein
LPGESFELGDGKAAVLPIPDGIQMPAVPLRARPAGGWELDPNGAVSGAVLLRGRELDPVAMAEMGALSGVAPGDHGLLQYGLFSVFFQCGASLPSLTKRSSLEALALLALASSTLIHVGGLGMVRRLMTPEVLGRPIELTSPDDAAARFGLRRTLAEPVIATVPLPETANAVRDTTPSTSKDPEGARPMPGPEGTPGLRGKEPRTEIPGPTRPDHPLGGLSDVLASDTGDEIKRSLDGIEGVSSAVRGLDSRHLVVGGGTGAGLIGGGPGGGGSTGGAPFSSGVLETGTGIGPGHVPGGRRPGTRPDSPAVKEHPVVFGQGSLGGAAGLTAEQVQRVVMRSVSAFKACFEIEASHNPHLRGGVTPAWRIDADGVVTSASVDSSTIKNPRVEGCVIRQVKSLHFPKSDAPTVVQGFPLMFAMGGS